jgi:hypothetical protein
VITLRHRKSGLGLASTLAVALGCLLLGPSAASASSVDCWGHVEQTTATKQRVLTYAFACSDTIKSFSLVSNIELSEFSTVADVFDPATQAPVEGETFSCEGFIPSDGFGCAGMSTGFHTVKGTVDLSASRCVKRRNQLRAWVVAVDGNGASTGPTQLTVPPRCAKSKAKKSSHRHR